MEKQQFEEWIIKYTPDDDYEDFVERLAIGAIAIIEEASRKMNVSIPEIVNDFYYGGIDKKKVQ